MDRCARAIGADGDEGARRGEEGRTAWWPRLGSELARRRRGRGASRSDGDSYDDVGVGKAPCARRAEAGARRGEGAGGWVEEGLGATAAAANGVAKTPRYGEGGSDADAR